MKKAIALLAALCLFLSLAACDAKGPDNPPETSGKEMPDVMKELAKEDSVDWMAGIWVELPGCELQQTANIPGVDVYSGGQDPIQATVTVQNGLDRTQDYYLMVLADGVPVDFSVDGSPCRTYPIALTAAQQVLNVELSPDFSLNLGRLDFLLLYDGDPQSDYHMTAYTVWLPQDGEEQTPQVLQNAPAQRPGVQGSFTGGTYGAWFWEGDALPGEDAQTAPHEIPALPGETLLLEAVTTAPGYYRTVVMLDGKPLSFTLDGQALSFLDWKADGDNMLQVPITLPEDLAITGSLFTITTPLSAEAISKSSLASWKVAVEDCQSFKNPA